MDDATLTPGVWAVEEIDDVVVTAFGETADGGWTLELQRGRDDADVARTYCVVVNGGPTHYGGITSWSVSEDAVELVFTEEAQASLGIGSVLRVSLRELSATSTDVGRALMRVLGDG